MSYDPVTPEQFKTAKPQFAGVDDSIVQSTLNEAGDFIGEDWRENDHRLGIIAYACHLLTLDGMGDNPESQSFAGGMAGFQTIKSGELSLTRISETVATDDFTTSWLRQTQCGKKYLMLRSRNGSGTGSAG